MVEVFDDPEEALDAMETLPPWKPHSLSDKVALMEEPTQAMQQRRRRDIVGIGYEKTNQKKKVPTATKTGKNKATAKRATKVKTVAKTRYQLHGQDTGHRRRPTQE